MSNTNTKTLEPALLYGGIAGGAQILHGVLLYTLDASFSTYAMIMTYALPIIVLAIMLYLFRNEYRGGTMTYSQSLGMGTLIMVFAGVLLAVYNFIFMKYIDPDFIKVIIQMQEDKMVAKGMDAETIERAMEMTSKMRSPVVMSVMALLSSAIMGFIYSLIVSIFLKKEPKDPFATVTE